MAFRRRRLLATRQSCFGGANVHPTPPPITVSLPTGNVTNSVSTATVILLPVTTTSVDPSLNYTGFQGDFSFDETVITFSDPFVEAAGMTANNWNVTGDILPGPPGDQDSARIWVCDRWKCASERIWNAL